ncbi:uncharacterized protein LOC124419852 [Lucilia cuprina]|uniref:uncharacterized protein LOC124419852 n=1 Tax=Lucilia cuprina TaxID=7375 RepID=UPI001F05D41B|nr:uncharacterized protein LOC124419852 [Lucilia cuprina]
MVEAVVAFLLMEEESCQRINWKILRDHSNPLELPESVFIGQYRLNKEASVMVLDIVKEHLLPSTIPCVIQLAATLLFLEEGSCQMSVGDDSTISLGKTTVSVVLWPD